MSELGVTRVPILRVEGGACSSSSLDVVAVERALEIHVNGEPFAVVMRTPGDDVDLVAGFLLSEGILAPEFDSTEIAAGGADVVAVTLAPEAADRLARARAQRRDVVMNASCGMCGRPTIESTRVAAPVLPLAWSMPLAEVLALPDRLVERQTAFRDTGGLHAALLAHRTTGESDLAEDVGRHNAVDRVIGRMWRQRRLPASDHVMTVSGRTSFEIVQKAWVAGVPMVVSVSAPSSLAIGLAEEAGLTLVGFARGTRCNIYTHASRISM